MRMAEMLGFMGSDPDFTMLGVNKFDAEGKLRREIYQRGAEG